MRNFFLFRKIEEIPRDLLEIYGNEKRWAMRACDDRTSINDSPYKIKDFREHGFSKDNIGEIYNKLNSQMEKISIPEKHRMFFICRVFFDKDVEMSGHVLKDRKFIYIDIFNGNRPSGKDWTPHHSFKIELGKGKLDNKEENNRYAVYVKRIAKDVLGLPIGSYADFTLLWEGYFFYHDLSVHSASKP